MEQPNVKIKFAINPGELSVFKPLEFALISAAFFFSADVREMAPISSSVENNATLTFLMIVYHAVYKWIEKEGIS
jgi:hypothetical protein